MNPQWVVYTSGPPTLADFTSTKGLGPPLCIDRSTGTLYYLAAGDIPTAVPSGGSGSVSWGGITGTLPAQT